MNFAAQDDTRVTATVLHAYNFESDNEDNVNTDDLSDLSDVFEEEPDEPVLSSNKSNLNESAISLDDITYDRDLKYINVPNGGRSKPVILQNNRLLKQVRTITSEASAELNELDQHYTDMDNRKRDHDKKFLVEFDTDHSGKARDARTKRSTRGRGRRGAGERPEGSGKSRMEEDNAVDVSDRGCDLDIVDREAKSSRRRNLGGGRQEARGGVGLGRGDAEEGGREPRAPRGSKTEPRTSGRNENKPSNRQAGARPPRGEKSAGRYGQPQEQELAELTEPHTVQGVEQHLEREYADYLQAAPSAFSLYADAASRPGRGPERVHPRAVPYQHPHAAYNGHIGLQQPYHPEPRHNAPRERHLPRDARLSHSEHRHQHQHQPYLMEEAAYAYDRYEAPLDRYGRAPEAYDAYQYQSQYQSQSHRHQREQPQHSVYPSPSAQRLFVPNQQGHQGQRSQERNFAAPQSLPQEPKLNAKAAEFVPTWTTG